MTELSQAALAAPAASALELGGPAAELVVASNALRREWKSAHTALSTSRHMLATLEVEYKASRKLKALVNLTAIYIYIISMSVEDCVCMTSRESCHWTSAAWWLGRVQFSDAANTVNGAANGLTAGIVSMCCLRAQ